MKIFFSYGHDENKPVVDKIKKHLCDLGHEIYIDENQIKTGDDWRQRITKNIYDSELVMGFLSKHSTRDPGVYLDELNIAFRDKGGCIATILLESENEVSPPVTVSHVQYLNMSDWRDNLDNNEWFQNKLNKIIEVINSPNAKHFVGEITELEERLKPVKQFADIERLTHEFVGRKWLLQNLEDWRRNNLDSRLLWISGTAGTGKSAFSAWLGHYGRVNVIGLNLCVYNQEDRRDAKKIIRTLAFQIATRLHDYRTSLLNRLKIYTNIEEELSKKQASDLFKFLIIEPLQLIDGGRSRDRFIIIIDALDETIINGKSELTQILSHLAQDLPKWLAMIVTSRPEEAILSNFSGLKPIEIKASSIENQEDIREYIENWLAKLNMDDFNIKEKTDEILSASEGNFLYVSMLRKGYEEGILELNDFELPGGLSALYRAWFEHRFKDYESLKSAISVILSSNSPIPELHLENALGLDDGEILPIITKLTSLFEKTRDGITTFHKSLKDWLINRNNKAFYISIKKGNKILFDYLWKEFVEWASKEEYNRGELDNYLVSELPKQILAADEDVLKEKLDDETYTLIKNAALGIPVFFETTKEWEQAAAWWQTNLRMAQVISRFRFSVDVANLAERLGDIYALIGKSDQAIEIYELSRFELSKVAKDHDKFKNFNRFETIVCDKIGQILFQNGDLQGALARYELALATRTKFFQMEENNLDWQVLISDSSMRIGNVLEKANYKESALERYVIALNLLYSTPNFDLVGCGRIMDANLKLGDISLAMGKLDVAQDHFQSYSSMCVALSVDDSENLELLEKFEIAHERLGTVFHAKHDKDNALIQYEASLAIAQRLAQTDPSNTGWQRDVMVSLGRIAHIRDDIQSWQKVMDKLLEMKARNILAPSDEHLIGIVQEQLDKFK